MKRLKVYSRAISAPQLKAVTNQSIFHRHETEIMAKAILIALVAAVVVELRQDKVVEARTSTM